MINNCIHVAIIDDGVNTNLYEIKLQYNVIISDELITLPCIIHDSKVTHGTICAAIINKNLKDNILLSSIRILGDSMKGTTDKLYAALDWCIANEVDVVNISLGSNHFFDYLSMRKEINDKYNKGLIMVCAANNKEYITYPASLSNAIGVKCDMNTELTEGEISNNNYLMDGIDYIAFSKYELVDKYGNIFCCSSFNSYAAPTVTALVANMMAEISKKKEYEIFKIDYIKEQLCKDNAHSRKQNQFYSSYNNPDWIRNAMVFYVDEFFVSDVPYYFNCIDIIHVNDEQALFCEIKRSIKNELDTIIIYSEKLIDKKVVENIIEITSEAGISVIYPDEQNLKYNHNNLRYIKHWYPAYRKFEKMDCSFNESQDSDIPSIVVYGKNRDVILRLIYEYNKLFYFDGYNAYISANNPRGIFYDCDYIPIIKDMTQKDAIKRYISEMVLIKRADIHVYGLCLDNIEQIRGYVNEMNIDIEVCIEEDLGKIYLFNIQIEKLNFRVKSDDLQYGIMRTFEYIKKELTEK